MIPYLKNKRITVVTTNAMVVPSILETDIHVIMIGGDVLKSTASIVGSITDNCLKDMFFDKAFIGATGYDLQSGINTPDSREPIKKGSSRKTPPKYMYWPTAPNQVNAPCARPWNCLSAQS